MPARRQNAFDTRTLITYTEPPSGADKALYCSGVIVFNYNFSRIIFFSSAISSELIVWSPFKSAVGIS